MEKIAKHVESLSVSDLKKKLQEHGLASGPITPTTKARFQSQLVEKLAEAGEKNEQSVKTKVESTVGNGCQKSTSVFFAISIPSETEITVGDNELVFSDKLLALKALKTFKGARLKSFNTEHDAYSFSHLAADALCASPLKQNGIAGDDALLSSGTGVSVESSPYRSVKTQDLCKLRKILEQGDMKSFSDLVWSNPRYLISSGDTPTILQEGFRYNALHVAAKFNQTHMCQFVLETLENPDFMYKLYSHSHETDETRTSRINFIVDLYLNTPDKGNCETPLHFACKFGHAGAVAILVAYPMTVTSMKNKHGETPKDVICSRCSRPTAKQKAEIHDLLEGHCYVPLIRSEDNVTQPVIGLPWSPDKSQDALPSTLRSWTPKDPVRTIKACAGPMSSSKAKQFHRKWTLPSNASVEQRKSYCTMKKDSEKGLERIGRDIAHEMGVPWAEYWPFLQVFADFSTQEGLDLLEAYLTKHKIALWLKEHTNSPVAELNFNESVLENSRCEPPKEEEKILTNISFDVDVKQKRDSRSIFEKEVLPNGELSDNVFDKSNSFSNDGEETEPKIVTSPMSSLLASFSGLTLLDKSLSDSLDISADEEGDLFYLCSDSEEDLSKNFEDLPNNLSDLSDSAGGNEIVENILKNSVLPTELKENQLLPNDKEMNGYFTPPVSKDFPVLYFFMNEDINSDLSDCISNFKTLKNDSCDFKFLLVLNLGECDDNEMSVHSDIVFIPSRNSVIDYKIFHDIPLELDTQSDLNKPSSLAQAECFHAYVRLRGTTGDIDTVMEALATPSLSVTSQIYIEGCSKPSKTDLTVYQAIEKMEIDCDMYGLTCKWRKNISNLVADKNFSWSSPANTRSQEILSKSAPQLSFRHLAGTPAALCQSPAQVRSHLKRAAGNGTWPLEDLRIKLFTSSSTEHF